MKNIFKKNQIIITALAIMLVIAGYLSFMEKGKSDTTEVGMNGAYDYDTYVETAKDDMTDSDLVSIENANMVDISDEDLLTVTDSGEILATTEGMTSTDVASTDVESTEVAETNGEEIETSAPGEAIIVSTTIGKSYFATAKLEREQLRAVSQERLLGIVNNENLTEDAKTGAIAGLIELTKIAENENDIEALLEAKGYSDSVVSITEGSVDVIVNAVEITEQDMAIIEDLVMRKAEVKAAEIFITPVVFGE